MSDSASESGGQAQRLAQIEAELKARAMRRRRRSVIVAVSLFAAITGGLFFRSLVHEAKAQQMLQRARVSERLGKYLIAERHLKALGEHYPRSRAARDAERLLEQWREEIGTQWLFVQAEEAERAGDFAKATQVYQRVGKEYPTTRLLGEARERLFAARREKAAQELLEHARSLERKCEFAEAAKAYETIVSSYPKTAGALTAQERVRACADAARVFQEAYDAARRGLFDAALARLDALLQAGLTYHGVYGGKGLVYELQRKWESAAEMWTLAQRAGSTEEGAKHLRACLHKLGVPVALLGVTSMQEVDSGMMVIGGQIVNNLPRPVRNVKIELRVFAEDAPGPGAKPLVTKLHVEGGPIAPGQPRVFSLRLRAPTEAKTVEPKLVGYEGG